MTGWSGIGAGVAGGMAVFLVLTDGLLVDKGNGLIGWGIEGRNG